MIFKDNTHMTDSGGSSKKIQTRSVGGTFLGGKLDVPIKKNNNTQTKSSTTTGSGRTFNASGKEIIVHPRKPTTKTVTESYTFDVNSTKENSNAYNYIVNQYQNQNTSKNDVSTIKKENKVPNVSFNANTSVFTNIINQTKQFQSMLNDKDSISSIDKRANEVLDGKWGSGQKRRELLEKEGYNYDLIQSRVNDKVLGTNTFSNKYNEFYKENKNKLNNHYNNKEKEDENIQESKNENSEKAINGRIHSFENNYYIEVPDGANLKEYGRQVFNSNGHNYIKISEDLKRRIFSANGDYYLKLPGGALINLGESKNIKLNSGNTSTYTTMSNKTQELHNKMYVGKPTIDFTKETYHDDLRDEIAKIIMYEVGCNSMANADDQVFLQLSVGAVALNNAARFVKPGENLAQALNNIHDGRIADGCNGFSTYENHNTYANYSISDLAKKKGFNEKQLEEILTVATIVVDGKFNYPADFHIQNNPNSVSDSKEWFTFNTTSGKYDVSIGPDYDKSHGFSTATNHMSTDYFNRKMPMFENSTPEQEVIAAKNLSDALNEEYGLNEMLN